jgi:hypothetical protein
LSAVAFIVACVAVYCCFASANEWRLFWICVGAIAFIVVGTVGYLALLPALGLRDTYQFDRKSWEYTQQAKLVSYFNGRRFDELIAALQSYDDTELKKLRLYIQSRTAVTQHAIQWQNAIPAMIDNFVLPLTIAGVIVAHSVTASLGQFLPIALYVSFAAIVGLTLFQNWRRQTIQAHAGTYAYILEAIKCMPRGRQTRLFRVKGTRPKI